MAGEIAIEVKSVTRRFGSLTAVDDLSFEVGEGEIFGLLGPNGAGKTTTINLILGLLTVHKGKIQVLGYDVASQTRQQRVDGKTFVISTNNMVEADTLCDRLLIIDHGKAITLDSPESLKSGMRYDVVTIRTSLPIDAPETLLANYDVQNISRPQPDELRFEMQNAEARAASLIKEISEGYQLDSILIARPSLDDVFLYHTGRALRE